MFKKFLLSLVLTIFLINCGDDIITGAGGNDNGTGEDVNLALARQYALIPNYNNDYCFYETYSLAFLACSLIHIPTIGVTEAFYSGREVLGEILGIDQTLYTNIGLYDLTFRIFTTEDDFLNAVELKSGVNRITWDFDGFGIEVDDFLYDQYLEFSRFNTNDSLPATGSSFNRYYELIPNYLNDECFKTNYNEIQFTVCSILALSSLKLGDSYLSGREVLANLAQLESSYEYSDYGYYDLYYTTDAASLINEFSSIVIVGVDGILYNTVTFLNQQLDERTRYFSEQL